MKTCKVKKYFAIFLLFSLCLGKSWADQYGRAEITLPRYMAVFFTGEPYDDVKDLHETFFKSHDIQHRAYSMADVSIPFSWHLKSAVFSTNLISTLNIEGISVDDNKRLQKEYLKHEFVGGVLTFENQLFGPTFKYGFPLKDYRTRLTYEIVVKPDNEVSYEFKLFFEKTGNFGRACAIRKGTIRGDVNYKAAVLNPKPVPGFDGVEENKKGNPADKGGKPDNNSDTCSLQ